MQYQYILTALVGVRIKNAYQNNQNLKLLQEFLQFVRYLGGDIYHSLKKTNIIKVNIQNTQLPEEV